MTGGPTLEGISPDQRFRRLYGAHHLEIHAYLRRRTDTETALDALAETFLVVWRRIDAVPSGDDARPWIYGVARKTLANQRRCQHRSAALHDKLAEQGTRPSSDPATVVVRNAEAWDVLDAMDRLRADDREVLRLAAWEDLAHAEIAEIFGCSTHAVDQRLVRAKKRLERELQRTQRKRRRATWMDSSTTGGST
ncbi:MAG: RNA polymerase sigma factor [Candidatus Eisenbacteria bacterium]|nr:RNA polymerase sigma factor [Candidatus Eisenbacteria bacterium]